MSKPTYAVSTKPGAPTNKLPLMPADELSYELDYARDVTNDACKIDKITRQLQWLADFIKHWEKVTRGAGA